MMFVKNMQCRHCQQAI